MQARLFQRSDKLLHPPKERRTDHSKVIYMLKTALKLGPGRFWWQNMGAPLRRAPHRPVLSTKPSI